MKEGKWIILDCDDVVFDIMAKFSVHLIRDLKIPVKGLPGSWLMGEWMGKTDAEALMHVMEFNENHEDFGNLDPIEGAIEGIRTLKEHGYQIAIVTASSTGEASKNRRLGNLDRATGGAIDEVHFVGLGESKEAILATFPPSIWVDDSPRNAVAGLSAGHTCILFPAHHNADVMQVPPPGVIAVSGWSALMEMIPELRAEAEHQM